MRVFACLVLAAVLITPFSTAFAETFRSKDWFWNNDEDNFFFAATMYSGNAIGQYCYVASGNCVYLVNVKLSCSEGDKYHALINSNVGHYHVKLRCSKEINGMQFFAITPFKNIDSVVRRAKRMAIVVPVQRNEFKVTRFSLSGSISAIEDMREAVEKAMERSDELEKGLPKEEYL